MPSDKPFFHDLRQPKEVITPQDEVLIRKTCKCGSEFMGPETQTLTIFGRGRERRNLAWEITSAHSRSSTNWPR
jgi:hypothetical protein